MPEIASLALVLRATYSQCNPCEDGFSSVVPVVPIKRHGSIIACGHSAMDIMDFPGYRATG